MLEGKLFVEKYLERLQLERNEFEIPSIENLSKLHKQHLINIPFENRTCFFKEKVTTSKEFLYNKIIQNGEGGVCFELNTLFFHLLKDLGYSAAIYPATVYNTKTNELKGHPTHILILITFENKQFLVDVGVSTLGFFRPFELAEGCELDQGGHGKFKLHKVSNSVWRLQQQKKVFGPLFDHGFAGQWRSLYEIYLEKEYCEDDVEKMCRHEIDENDLFIFKKMLVCERFLPNGMKAMHNDELLIVSFLSDDIITKERIKITSPEHRKDLLKIHFDYEFNHQY